MSLTSGTLVGHYAILHPLGAGGMGEVYRARDTTLGREVAIKVLPEHFAADPDRMARFEREAKTLASLNHPHIAQIYGVESAGATRAIVMELVEGTTLAEHVPPGIRESLQIAAQIADALDCAHEKGIVHRDLKPANVKIREDGTVKVLDFGLAKVESPGSIRGEPLLHDAAQSPTLTSPAMTERGMILGTAAYMAPEQARGKPLDKRADIWAFGVVLFEMLSGKRLFGGETVSDTLAALLRQDIPWSDLPADTPPAIRRLLERLLDKDPKHRLRDIGDAKLEIEDVLAGRHPATPAPGGPDDQGRPLPKPKLPWVIAALVGVVAALGGWMLGRGGGPSSDGRWQAFTAVTDAGGEETSPSISPDGSTIAYATRANGTWDVHVQRVGGRNSTPVAADPDRDESGPAFSPDGKLIAFHEGDEDGGIFIVGATGESSKRITDAGFHPAWSPDGTKIAFSTEEIFRPAARPGTSALRVVDASGGATRDISGTGDAAQPSWSPSGERIVYWSNTAGQRDIYTIPAGGGERTAVVQDAPLDWCPVWAPDGRSVYFASDRGGSTNLWRIAVDQSSGRVTGSPDPVTGGVQAALEQPAISKDGTRLVFRSKMTAVNPVSIAFDPVSGRAAPPVVLGNSNTILVPNDASADGRWLAYYNLTDQQEDIFVSAADGSGLRRITDDPARDRQPLWMPDGKSLVFYSNRGERWEIWRVGRDGGNLSKLAGVAGADVVFPVLSPTGDRVAFSVLLTRQAFIADLRTTPVTVASLKQPTVGGGNLVPTSWSADGAKLAGRIQTQGGRPIGIGVYHLAAGAARKVGDDMTNRVSWLSDSRRVVYFTRAGQLVILDTASSQRTVVDVRLPFPPMNEYFALSKDNRTITYGGVRSESDIWMVERK